MRKYVFISHSKRDKAFADRIVEILEKNQIPCWIAPRDIPAGNVWSGAIMEAIETCQIMLLLLSSHSNYSEQVLTEIETAKDRGIPIISMRIEEVQLSPSIKYFVRSYQWLDAFGKQFDNAISKLLKSVKGKISDSKQVDSNSFDIYCHEQMKMDYQELYDAFWEDGKISDKERKVLKKRQLELGLSDEEIAKIEKQFLGKKSKKTSEESKVSDNDLDIKIEHKKIPKPSKKNYIHELIKICQSYKDHDDYFFLDSISDSKLKKVRSAFMIPNFENIIAIINCSKLGSNKNGLAICENGMYWHNRFDKSYRVSWSLFRTQSFLSVDKTSIAIGGLIFNLCASKFDKSDLLDLLGRIQNLLLKMNPEKEEALKNLN